MSEVKLYPVPESYKQDTHFTKDEYEAQYKASIENPDEFWGEKANEFLETALAGYEELREDEQSIDLKVEVVRSCAATGDITKAAALINELNDHEEFNDVLASRIDRISEEPVSESGKNEIKAINRKGIKYYENKKFEKAISYFNKALKRYPKHIGIRLNLAQAILGQLSEKGPEANLVQQCIEPWP